MKTPLQEVYDECRFLSENLEVSHLENEKSIKEISEGFKQKEGQMNEMPANYEKELVSLQGQIAKLCAEALITEEARATDKPKTKQPKKVCGNWQTRIEALGQEVQRLKDKNDDQRKALELVDQTLKAFSENIVYLESRIRKIERKAIVRDVASQAKHLIWTVFSIRKMKRKIKSSTTIS